MDNKPEPSPNLAQFLFALAASAHAAQQKRASGEPSANFLPLTDEVCGSILALLEEFTRQQGEVARLHRQIEKLRATINAANARGFSASGKRAGRKLPAGQEPKPGTRRSRKSRAKKQKG